MAVEHHILIEQIKRATDHAPIVAIPLGYAQGYDTTAIANEKLHFGTNNDGVLAFVTANGQKFQTVDTMEARRVLVEAGYRPGDICIHERMGIPAVDWQLGQLREAIEGSHVAVRGGEPVTLNQLLHAVPN